MISVLLAIIFGAALGWGWTLLRAARAQREALAERNRAAASPVDGQDMAAARALTNYLARIRAQIRDHDAAFSRLQREKALAWNIHDRADIERDRKLIRDFLDTNSRLMDSLKNGEDFVRAELNTAKLPAAVRDSALDLYAKSQAPLVPLHMRVRHCDQVIGENAMAILDLLNLNSAAWSRDAATGQLNFSNTIVLAAFQDHVQKMQAAANKRKEAQDEVVSYQRSHPP